MLDNSQLSFAEAILKGTEQAMDADPSVILMGLGVPDPKSIFGTTAGLEDKFGPSRVMDTPTAENGVTGFALGASLIGIRPIITHQRVEFALLSVEQIINQAAKWSYMTAGAKQVPMVIRLIIGRGWGQGPQHSQSLEPLFAHIPGLKVVAPSNPADAKGLLITAAKDNNPVIYLEHRWLHGTFGYVPQEPLEVPIGKARIALEGSDISIVASSFMVVEALRAAKVLKEAGIKAEVIDLRSYRPLDIETISSSVEKTGKILAVDLGWSSYGISSEIITRIVEMNFKSLKSSPMRMGVAEVPIPSTRSLADLCYPSSKSIVLNVGKIMGVDLETFASKLPDVSDIPNKDFNGPF